MQISFADLVCGRMNGRRLLLRLVVARRHTVADGMLLNKHGCVCRLLLRGLLREVTRVSRDEEQREVVMRGGA